MIFKRSSGDTTVLDAAPAHPPAMKYEATSGDTDRKEKAFRGGVTRDELEAEELVIVLCFYSFMC